MNRDPHLNLFLIMLVMTGQIGQQTMPPLNPDTLEGFVYYTTLDRVLGELHAIAHLAGGRF